jgi:hypothetical protein
MNASDIIAQIKPIHDSVLALQTQIGKNPNISSAYAQGARTALSTAINQMMLHQFWVEPKLPAAATPPATSPTSAPLPPSSAAVKSA